MKVLRNIHAFPIFAVFLSFGNKIFEKIVIKHFRVTVV